MLKTLSLNRCQTDNFVRKCLIFAELYEQRKSSYSPICAKRAVSLFWASSVLLSLLLSNVFVCNLLVQAIPVQNCIEPVHIEVHAILILPV